MTHDVCGPGTIGIFYEKFGRNAKVWDPNKVVVIPDHYIFTADLLCHRNVQTLRDFVREQGLKYYYDPEFVKNEPGMPNPYRDPNKTNYKGVCHKALPEEGHVRPGEILLGTDSHTCTAGAFGQFATGVGNTDAAFVLGTGKTWLKVPPTMKFTFHGQIPPYLTAKDLILAVIGEIGVDGATYRAMYFAGDGVRSLTLEDRMTLTNMAIEDFLADAGCSVGPSGCAACLGGPSDTFGRLNSTEVCVSTTNRNFPGRMGSTKSAVYLASPLTVAASALTGHVTDPRDFVSSAIETGMAGIS